MVIGGAEIYRLFLPLADRIELTEIALDPKGDAVIAPPDPAYWRETAREDHPADEAGRPAYSFVTLTRTRRCVAGYSASSPCCSWPPLPFSCLPPASSNGA